MTEHFDIVIVGGGTAGALCAARLVERTDARILVLEAGPPFPRLALGVPLASYRLRRPWSWEFFSVPQPALDGRSIRYPMGKVLGGSSSVNAMIAAQGPAADYDAWAADGCEGWSWDDLEPCWRRATAAGRERTVSVEPPSFTAPFTDALIKACEEYGLTTVERLTGEQSQTCGRFALFQRQRRRFTTADVLAEARDGGRLVVKSHSPVRRLLLDGNRAIGVVCGDARSASTIHARRGVVLSAGVFGSPAILMRSGIGSAVALRAAGITPGHHVPGVGENLQDHVGVSVVWRSSAPSPGRKSRWIPAAIEYAIGRTGVMASNGCEGGAFLGTPGLPPDLEIAALFQSWWHPRGVEMEAILMHPESRGVVTLDPHRPFGPPRIDPRLLSAPEDVRRLCEGIERIRDIARQPSLRDFGLTEELLPGTGDVGAFLRRHASTHYHPVGTCRMGVDDMSVVDPGLAVQGMRSLWVCDASVVPRLPACHSAATAMIIGERGADLIARRLAGG